MIEKYLVGAAYGFLFIVGYVVSRYALSYREQLRLLRSWNTTIRLHELELVEEVNRLRLTHEATDYRGNMFVPAVPCSKTAYGSEQPALPPHTEPWMPSQFHTVGSLEREYRVRLHEHDEWKERVRGEPLRGHVSSLNSPFALRIPGSEKSRLG